MAYYNAKARAKKLGVPVTITVEWLVKNSVETCPLLGVPLTYSANKPEPKSASIDRICSAGGYTPEIFIVLAVFR